MFTFFAVCRPRSRPEAFPASHVSELAHGRVGFSEVRYPWKTELQKETWKFLKPPGAKPQRTRGLWDGFGVRVVPLGRVHVEAPSPRTRAVDAAPA